MTLPQSVPSPSEVQARTRDVVRRVIRLDFASVSSCSRSTPLALACASRHELRVHVQLTNEAPDLALGVLSSRESGRDCVRRNCRGGVARLRGEASQPSAPPGVTRSSAEFTGRRAQTIDQHESWRMSVASRIRVARARASRGETRAALWAVRRKRRRSYRVRRHLNAAFVSARAEARELPALTLDAAPVSHRVR